MTKKNTLLTLVLLTLATFGASALNIPMGTFYFDNSLTKYSVVKFVFGSYSNPESYVMTMTDEGDNIWSITFDEAVPWTRDGEDGGKHVTLDLRCHPHGVRIFC